MPEIFPPDPYAIKDPASALAHYVGGSGTPMNYYMNELDTSGLDLGAFPKIKALIDDGVPGTYHIDNSLGRLETGQGIEVHHFTEAAVIGGVSISANGVLTIGPNKGYHFNGWIGAPGDEYTSHARSGRTVLGDFSNSVLGVFHGKRFPVYIVGTTPFSRSGQVP